MWRLFLGGTGNLYIYSHYRIQNSHKFSAWSTVFAGGIKLNRYADYTLISDGHFVTLYVDKTWMDRKKLSTNIGTYFTSNDVYIGKRPGTNSVFKGNLCRVNIKNYPIGMFAFFSYFLPLLVHVGTDSTVLLTAYII